ncbi:Leucine rich repeat protein, partial [Globisporangium splendens]
MGQAATKAKEARAQAKSKPKQSKSVMQQKIKSAQTTGMLALSDHKLKKVPAEVVAMPLLRTLDLSKNRIEELPMEINALGSLKTLKLVSNALTTLPDLSGLLVLDGNALESIPSALPPNLTKLSLMGNKLREIPVAVTNLKLLKELDLTANAIEQIPDHIENLSDLVDLTIDANNVRLIPAALAKCAKLKVLSARSNKLTGKTGAAPAPQSIAVEILSVSNVHIMNLEGNPMTKFDLEDMDGFDKFFARRTESKNKEIHGGLSADVSLCGLD